MREAIKEFLEPSTCEKQELWRSAVFVFDTNVLLNLYRYSAKTRSSLLEAFESFKERVWMPYQVAYEYMSRRCEVIYETVNRYDQFKKEIELFSNKAIDTLRLTSFDEEISELNRYLYKWLDSNKDRNLLVLSTENDEILGKILSIFDGKVGNNYSDEELSRIKEEGKKRYEKKIPPGYKDDKKKQNQNDDNNAFGDYIIWKQIIEYSKSNSVGIIYITHDQKEDWWNIVKGKTIGPRIELRREFERETHQKFHMYSMNSFITTYNKMNEKPIDKSAIEEVNGLEKSINRRKKEKTNKNSIGVNELIVRKEETLQKIESRISRRENFVNTIEEKYLKKELELPENIQIQYDNTKAKIRELEDTREDKLKELEALKSMSDFSLSSQ